MRPKTHAYPIRYLFAPFIALISLFWMTGCANPEIDTQTNKSSLRVMHMGEKNSQLRIEINGDTRTQLPYGKSSGYIQLTPGTYTIKAYANGEAVASLTQVIDVKEQEKSSWIVFRGENSLQATLANDIQGEVDKDNTKLRVVMATRAKSDVDVYRSEDKDSTLFANLTYKDISTYEDILSGKRTLTLVQDGQYKVEATIETPILEKGKAYTLILDGQLQETDNANIKASLFQDEGDGRLEATIKAEVDISVQIGAKASLRVSHMASAITEPIELQVDGTVKADINADTTTGFLDIATGQHTVALRNRVTGQLLATKEMDLKKDQKYDLFVVNSKTGAELLTNVQTETPNKEKPKLRILQTVKGTESFQVRSSDALFASFGVAKNNTMTAYQTLNPNTFTLNFVAEGKAAFTAIFDAMTLEKNKLYTIVLRGDWRGESKKDLQVYLFEDDDKGVLKRILTMNEKSRIVPTLMTFHSEAMTNAKLLIDGKVETTFDKTSGAIIKALARGTHEITLTNEARTETLAKTTLQLTSRKAHSVFIAETLSGFQLKTIEDSPKPPAQEDEALIRVVNLSSLGSILNVKTERGLKFVQSLGQSASSGFKAVISGAWKLNLFATDIIPGDILATINAELQAKQTYTLLIEDGANSQANLKQHVDFRLIASQGRS